MFFQWTEWNLSKSQWKIIIYILPIPGQRKFSIYTLSDLGDFSDLIGSLSRTIQQYSPPSEWIMCELGFFPIFLQKDLLKVHKILGLSSTEHWPNLSSNIKMRPGIKAWQHSTRWSFLIRIRHLHVSHNTPVCPQNFVFFISPGYYSRHKILGGRQTRWILGAVQVANAPWRKT